MAVIFNFGGSCRIFRVLSKNWSFQVIVWQILIFSLPDLGVSATRCSASALITVTTGGAQNKPSSQLFTFALGFPMKCARQMVVLEIFIIISPFCHLTVVQNQHFWVCNHDYFCTLECSVVSAWHQCLVAHICFKDLDHQTWGEVLIIHLSPSVGADFSPLL